ncbi:MAG: tetratricopeptide repeat protein [Deltaproteobacteria bacterium]|nr:tetratricopeptide repeat protein [Deltaproteobacteria bacterium]
MRYIKNPSLACILLLIAASFLFACSSDPARERFDKAEGLLSDGRHAEALAEYTYVVNNFQGSPDAPRSQYRIAFIYENFLTDKKRARDAYFTLSHVYPNSAEALLAGKSLAKMHSDDGEHEKAIAEYQKLIGQRPEERDRLKYLIAMEYMKTGDLKQARIELTELLKAASDKEAAAEAGFQIANTYYLEGDTKNALDAYDAAASKYPDSRMAIEARLSKAKALEDAGRLDEAIEILRSLQAKHPDKEVIGAKIEWIENRVKEDGARMEGK